ncbi:MAG TPA: ATP-binding protein [Patescibacteria group bacterium]|nr:ATP-binding protein [Patescibacteria group bacterium]
MRLVIAMLGLWMSGAVSADRIAPTFRAYGVGDGLPSMTVMDLAQDRNGYVWIATRDGLARFDGRGFVVFRNAPDQADSLPCNDVQTVLATRDGRIWAGCESTGFAMLDDSDATRFKRFSPDERGDGLRGGDVFALAETPGGALYVGTYAQGLVRLRAGDAAPVALDRLTAIDAALRTATVMDMTVDEAGTLWVGTLDALWRIDAADADAPGPVRKVAELPIVNSVQGGRDGRLWVGVNGALFRRDRDADTLVRVPLPEGAGMVDGVADGSDGSVWVAARGGLLRLRADGGSDWIKPRAAVANALPDPDIRDLMRDHEGGLWLGTGAHGVAYLRPDWARFQVHRHDPVDPTSPATGWRSGIARCPDDSLWMLVRSGELTRVAPDHEVRRWRSAAHAGTLSKRRHSSVWCDAEGVLWLPNRDGVLRFDPERDVLDDGLRAGEPWAAGPPEVLTQSRDGRLWMGALTAGLNIRAPDGRNTVWRAGAHGIDNDDFEQIATDPEGRVWIADATGLRGLRDDASAFVALDVLPRERVHAFVFLAADRLLVHQLGHLRLLTRREGVWSVAWTLVEADGLPIAEAATLVADTRGQVWMTNPRGLWTIDPQRERIRPVTRADGLPAIQFETIPSAVRQGEDLVFVVGEGLLRLAADVTMAPAAVVLPLRWAPLRYLRDEAPGVLHPARSALTFGPRDHELAIGARLLSFIEPDEHRYRFRIDGFDADWVDAGASGERLIARLPAGDYRVQVQAANARGQSAPAPLTTRIVVAPPWWASAWAYAGYAALAALALMLSWRANRRRLEARHAMVLAEERRRHAESASAAKSEFLATVGHEIRTPMTGVLGMAELLAATPLDEKQRHYLDTVQQSGRHLLHLVNDLLDLSRAEAGKLGLHAKPTPLAALLREVFDGFAPLARRKGLACELDLAADLPAVVEVDPVRLRQIVLNLANNALKFTARGRIELRARREDGAVRIEVADTGPGMTPDECARLFQRFSQTSFGAGLGGSGLGLSIVHQLAQLMGGDVRLRSEPGVGSVFSVRLPLPEVVLPDAAGIAPASRTADAAAGIVLLVEDDAATREVIATWLRATGVAVREADQAMHALHHAEAGIAVIVSDLDLPGMNGLQLLPLLRQRIGRRVPALAITARSEANTEAEARAAGFDGFLRKPLDAAGLHEALAALSSAQRNPAA